MGGSRRIWLVVRGQYPDGVVVRQGPRSPVRCPERLSLGAYVEELYFGPHTGSLHFKRLSGRGPADGWVSTIVSNEQHLFPIDELWEVVGCADIGGIAVHEEMSLCSPRALSRLSGGAIIREVEHVGGASRLRYERLMGTGPEAGWVSTSLPPKDLLVMEEADFYATAEIIWKVVGGSSAGGVIVRKGKSTSSRREAERLSTGCLVREVEFLCETFRLHYELVSGDGPASGWVSTRVSGDPLVMKLKTRLARYGSDSLQPHTARRPELGCRTLRWTAKVTDAYVSQLQAQVVLSLGGTHGSTSAPVCTVETWAEDSRGEELAFCRGQVHCSGRMEAQVLWLGRSSSRAVEDSVRGWRYIEVSHSRRKATVAEAVLGMNATILEVFGAAALKLQVLDNGSGRLVSFYRNLGFVECSEQDEDTTLWMEAAPAEVARLVPAAWSASLVPAEFDALAWVRRDVPRLWLERARLGRLPRWDWAISEPESARMSTRMRRCDDYGEFAGSILVDVLLSGTDGEELAFCQGAVRMKQQLLSVVWLGRSGARGIHADLRGRPLYEPCCNATPLQGGAADGDGASWEAPVTSGLALLGFLALLSCMFGVDAAELRPPGSDSERLVHFLQGVGFQVVETQWPSPKSHLRIPCNALALRCCPREWCLNVLGAEDMNQAALDLEDLEEAGEDTLERDEPVCSLPRWLLSMS